ncbi:MAG: hypothetical protein ACR2M7_02960 [Bdellovibrionales bacterium]
MSQENNTQTEDQKIDAYLDQELAKAETTEVKSDDSTIETLVADRVKAELAKIKSNLDSAYSERDQYKNKVAELAKEKQKAEIETLEKAGKHSEVLKIEMNEIKKELDLYKKRNTELSRDNVVKSQLSGLDFRNEKAAALAHSDIINSLKQDSTGAWMHESGVSVNEAITNYAKSDSNAFMFNVKANAGSNVEAKATKSAPAAPTKALKDMTQEEVLKAVEAGQLGSNHTWTE